MPLVDPLEQIIESQDNEDEEDLGGELSRDAEAKECLGCREVRRRRCRVSVHNQLAGDVEEGEGARYRDQ